MKKRIIIEYDPHHADNQALGDGDDPLDLFSWLENELNNMNIKASIHYQEFADEAEINAARRLYATDDLNIDEGAAVSRCDDGSYWVQAWVNVEKGD